MLPGVGKKAASGFVLASAAARIYAVEVPEFNFGETPYYDKISINLYSSDKDWTELLPRKLIPIGVWSG